MRKHFIYWLALGFVVITGCQKELSFEGGNTPAEGSLQSDVSGDCLPKTVNGIYEAALALTPASNTITVQVNVTHTGLYTIATDTVNGYYFRGTGTFTALGANTITLRSNGTPFAAGVNNFVVSFDSTICDIPVTVLPAGTTKPAVFAFAGAGGSCTGAVPAGTYTKDVALNSTNTVTISVNVTTIGTYGISTTFQGMTFAASGIFATTGAQTVTLNGTGKPTNAGSNIVPLTAGTSSCNFTINVTSPADGTLGGASGPCTPSNISGTYAVGTALVPATNTVQVQINVTTAGTYNITTDTLAGIYFSGSATIGVGNNQLIILVGNGTPTTSGPQTFTVKFGSSTCTFLITIQPGLSDDYFPRTTNSNWSYEIDADPLDSFLIKVIPNTLTASANTYNIFMETADASAGFDTSGYYRRSGGDYSHWTNLKNYLGFDNDQWVSFIFLKDNQAAGTTWNSASYTGAIGGTAITMRIKYTILQKDVPISLTTSTGTVNYANTIIVQEQYEAQTGPTTWVSLDGIFGFYKDYYSKGIGWIQDEYFDASSTTTPASVFKLRRKEVF